MPEVVPVERFEMIDSAGTQGQGLVELQQGSPGIGFKIPKGMVQIKEEMPVFLFGLQMTEFSFVPRQSAA